MTTRASVPPRRFATTDRTWCRLRQRSHSMRQSAHESVSTSCCAHCGNKNDCAVAAATAANIPLCRSLRAKRKSYPAGTCFLHGCRRRPRKKTCSCGVEERDVAQNIRRGLMRGFEICCCRDALCAELQRSSKSRGQQVAVTLRFFSLEVPPFFCLNYGCIS